MDLEPILGMPTAILYCHKLILFIFSYVLDFFLQKSANPFDLNP